MSIAFVAALLILAGQPATTGGASHPYTYDRTAPLHLSERLVRVEDEVEVYAIAFDSPQGGRATGKLFVPRGLPGQRHAGLILAHGAPGSTANLDPRALFFARKGAVVVGIDAAFARRDPAEPMNFTARDVAEQIQTIVDLRRAVDVLAARADVDADRIGFVGNSYGAAMGGILAGVEDRIAAFVLAVGDAGLVAHFADRDGGWLPPVRDLPAAQRDAWVTQMRAISGEALLPKARGERLFLQNGRDDQAVLPHVAAAFHALAPAGAEIRWYPSGHRLPPSHFADQLAFLHRRIGMAAPTDADLAGPVFPPPSAPR